jgi:hypothetical protein
MDELYQLVSVPVIMAVVQVIKKTDRIPSNYMPLVSLTVGLLAGVVAAFYTLNPISIITGFIAGLASSGAYDATRTVTR